MLLGFCKRDTSNAVIAAKWYMTVFCWWGQRHYGIQRLHVSILIEHTEKEVKLSLGMVHHILLNKRRVDWQFDNEATVRLDFVKYVDSPIGGGGQGDRQGRQDWIYLWRSTKVYAMNEWSEGVSGKEKCTHTYSWKTCQKQTLIPW